MKCLFLVLVYFITCLAQAGGWVKVRGPLADKIRSATPSPSLCGSNKMALATDVSTRLLKDGSVFFTNMADWNKEYLLDARSEMNHPAFVAKWKQKFKSARLFEIDSQGTLKAYPATDVQVGVSKQFIEETTENAGCFEQCKGQMGSWVHFEGKSAFSFSPATGAHLLYPKQKTTAIKDTKNPLFCFYESVRLRRDSEKENL